MDCTLFLGIVPALTNSRQMLGSIGADDAQVQSVIIVLGVCAFTDGCASKGYWHIDSAISRRRESRVSFRHDHQLLLSSEAIADVRVVGESSKP